MILLIKIISIFIIIKYTFSAPNLGECGGVGYKAVNFDSCKGKTPYDSTNEYCCFLKSGKTQECVEVAKVDIDNNAVKITIKEIEKGIYEYWENNKGESLNTIYEKLDTFECDNTFFIQFKKSIFLLTILLIIL